MSNLNKHGLNRTIPQAIKREVRQNSFFGCVICGAGICEFDHVDPEFEDAKIHDADCMVLLCGSCHSKKTRGIIGVKTIKDAMKEPFCSNNTASDFLDFGNGTPKIQFGNTLFINPKILISIDGVSILTIKPPENAEQGKRSLLNAIFHNIYGVETFRIVDNIWHGSSINWDIESKGKRIIIRTKKGVFALDIENIPDDKFVIHKLNMSYKGYVIIAASNEVQVITPSDKEIFALNGGGTIEGDVVLNIVNERLTFSNLETNDVNLKLSGDVSHSVFKNVKITL